MQKLKDPGNSGDFKRSSKLQCVKECPIQKCHYPRKFYMCSRIPRYALQVKGCRIGSSRSVLSEGAYSSVLVEKKRRRRFTVTGENINGVGDKLAGETIDG